jgi:hypothetical protein
MSETSIGPAEDKATQLARYGILRVATEHFTVGGYCYSKIEDAIAEARRRLPSTGERS